MNKDMIKIINEKKIEKEYKKKLRLYRDKKLKDRNVLLKVIK